jgi:N-formylglutamate deformylase
MVKPFFISIPHSGERVPAEADWLQGLPESVLMCDVDRFVDRLYQPVLTDLKIPFVKTEWHRYVVDLNRLPGDVDADSVQGSANPPGQFTTGLHWVKTTKGTRLMPKPMSPALHEQLVRNYFNPFHVDVRNVYRSFLSAGLGKVYHLDAHSMPSRGTAAHRDPGENRKSIVVSDWEGRSCEPAFKDLVIEAFSQAGLEVGYNWPYLGGRVTQTYGRPDQGQHAIQVEINRALYMDEDTKQLVPERAAALSRQLGEAIRYLHQRIDKL